MYFQMKGNLNQSTAFRMILLGWASHITCHQAFCIPLRICIRLLISTIRMRVPLPEVAHIREEEDRILGSVAQVTATEGTIG